MNLLEALPAMEKLAKRTDYFERFHNVVFTLPNDYQVSLGYGPQHHGSNRDPNIPISVRDALPIRPLLATAEVVEVYITDPGHRPVHPESREFDPGGIAGYYPVERVLTILAYIGQT